MRGQRIATALTVPPPAPFRPRPATAHPHAPKSYTPRGRSSARSCSASTAGSVEADRQRGNGVSIVHCGPAPPKAGPAYRRFISVPNDMPPFGIVKRNPQPHPAGLLGFRISDSSSTAHTPCLQAHRALPCGTSCRTPHTHGAPAPPAAGTASRPRPEAAQATAPRAAGAAGRRFHRCLQLPAAPSAAAARPTRGCAAAPAVRPAAGGGVGTRRWANRGRAPHGTGM